MKRNALYLFLTLSLLVISCGGCGKSDSDKDENKPLRLVGSCRQVDRHGDSGTCSETYYAADDDAFQRMATSSPSGCGGDYSRTKICNSEHAVGFCLQTSDSLKWLDTYYPTKSKSAAEDLRDFRSRCYSGSFNPIFSTTRPTLD